MRPAVLPTLLITMMPSSAVEPSAVAVASANKHNLLSITAEYTPVMAAVLMAALSPATSLFGIAGTATDVPLITIVLVAVKSAVTALVAVAVGQLNFQSLLPTSTQVL